MDTIGVVFCHGFELPCHSFDYREIGLCIINGTDHCLLEYACGLGINALSKKERESIEDQTHSVHGLGYEGHSILLTDIQFY